MFEMFELISDIERLREVGLTQDEVEGYLEIFFDDYARLVGKIEVV